MTGSALYEGTVAHRRRTPEKSGLRYRIFMPLLDLDELPGLLDRHPLWSARRPAPVRFRAGDFLVDESDEGPADPSGLAERARALVRERTGAMPDGPVRLLASPRFLGVGFNPVSFFFLYDEAGERTEAVIAEVTNTPWGGRHAYVARREPGTDGPITARFDKRLHVSPFNPMDQTYELRAGEPGDSLAISIANHQDGERIHDAGLSLKRRELTRAAMTRMILRYPPSTIATIARIYSHGLRMRLRGVPHYPHPKPQSH